MRKIIHQGNFVPLPEHRQVMDSDNIITIPEMNLTFKEIFYRFRVGAPIPSSRNMSYDIGADNSSNPNIFSPQEEELLNSPDEPDSYADAYAELMDIRESRSARRKVAYERLQAKMHEERKSANEAQENSSEVSETK